MRNYAGNSTASSDPVRAASAMVKPGLSLTVEPVF